MLSLRHWPAAISALVLLAALGLTANAQTYSSEAPLTDAHVTDGTGNPLVAMTLESAESGYRIVPVAEAESGHTGAPQSAGGDPTLDDSGDEILALKKRIIEVQNKGKLGFRKLVVCTSVEGYGLYSPLKSGKALRGFVLYFEPANVSTLVTSDRYIIDLTVDLVAFDGSGKAVSGKKGILKIKRISRSPIMDLFFRINLNLKKPRKKDLIIKTVLHDNIKNQSTAATYRINVQPKNKKSPDKV